MPSEKNFISIMPSRLIAGQNPAVAFARPPQQSVSVPAARAPPVVTREVQTVVVEKPAPVQVLTVGRRGQKGDPGPASRDVFVSAGPLSSGRVVYQRSDGRVDYASSFDLATAETIVGVTVQAANAAGVNILVQMDGEATDSGWIWTPEQPVFLVAAGLMAHTPAVGAAFIFQVGAAIDATRMRVRLEDHPTYVQ